MSDRTVHLGFAVGSGESVEIPLLNLAVTGMTQRSGKTTTLEALVARSGARALTFVTKRGEGSFAEGRRIQPYFRDRADWQFVTGLLDATLQEKNKFLRSWIIKICRNTRTLADVHTEVRKALEKATGINEGVYTQLDAYLDLIVPEIERADLAQTLELAPGLNVMDVSSYPAPMQMLFVQSALDFINATERDTIVVIPEAWEMVPEGRNTPVKASAESLVRKGSAIGNHIWLDSQDMAGVSKVLLRGCSVWLIGVQREANEIKRNLSNIPASIKKPTPAAVATLEKGQFYACWGTHAVKTYVQPAWMSDDDAQYVARGFSIDPARLKAPAPMASVAEAWNRGDDKYRVEVLGQKPLLPIKNEESTVTEQEAQRLRDENRELKQKVEDLYAQVKRLSDSRLSRAVADDNKVTAEAATAVVTDALLALNGDGEAIYQYVKTRLSKEAPALLRVLTVKPELEVQVEKRVITADGSSTQGRLARLVAAGFLNDSRSFSDCLRELERTGLRVNNKSLAQAFKGLVEAGFLSKEGAKDYRAVAGMKVRIVET